MKLQLRKLDPLPRGIYGPSGTLFAKRMGFLHPDAAEAFQALEREAGGLVYSDMYRSADSSLHAVETKEGTKSPGYSAHGFGLAVDVAVDASLARLGCSYAVLLERLAAHGWHSHRRDGERGPECWHFNWLGPHAQEFLATTNPTNHATWGHAAEAAILAAYPELATRMEAAEIQTDLARVHLYGGAIDGQLGPLSRQAALAFARAWRVPEHGPVFERTLRFVAAEIVAG